MLKFSSLRFLKITLLVLLSVGLHACSNDEPKEETPENGEVKELTIFFVNDQHGQLDNFAKIKHIVDAEKELTNVIVACSGDIFSGNPVVDNHEEKGFPMIDIMNRVGFDVSVLGNHEFDYGETVLKNRIEQANFAWVCANVDMLNTGIPEPNNYFTISVDDLKVTFLGLVETNGKHDDTIPLTHPWKVQNIEFERPEDIIANFSNVKAQENADLYIALTHLGYSGYNGNLGDVQIAEQHPYFDLIIGGHSHQEINSSTNGIPIYQAGSYLNKLGKIKLKIKNNKVEQVNFELIDLNQYIDFDADLKTIIDTYNNAPELNDVIGYSQIYHPKTKVGCFYADALKDVMNVDVSFQNSGGVRNSLNEGDITKREIFQISPFNNGTVIYTMTIAEIKTFLIGSKAGLYYAGFVIEQSGTNIIIKNLSGTIIPDNQTLSIGINDYIPARFDTYFPVNGNVQELTAAETLISYLENTNNQVNYPNCERYFRYD